MLFRSIEGVLTAPTIASAPPITGTGSVPAGTYRGGLAAFLGKYHSDEVEATFTITESGERLFAQRETDVKPAELQRVSADDFRFGGMTLRFIRDAKGTVERLAVDAGRVRNIRFTRVVAGR